ncbi:MAG: HPr family phosphocarrier protein [Candidatus Zixiibacteriota bacterium]|nr:MAG: HPr family phosphocarrier protein [candidate division Zixibacteria bacterium]
MVQKTVKVINRLGMHARPSAMFVNHASRYKSEIFIEKAGLKVNGKSIIGVMTLAAEMGAELILHADGIDEKEALRDLTNLVTSGFGELKNL